MKRNLLLLSVFALFALAASAQVQLDKPVVFTGVGTNAKVTGIDDVSGNKDAVSVDYYHKGGLIYAADNSNSANAYNVPLSPTLSGGIYTVGMAVNFKANLANTGAATLNVSGLGGAPIVKNYNVALVANDIQAGQMVTVMYDGANWQMLSQSGNVPSSNNNTGDPTLIYTTNGF